MKPKKTETSIEVFAQEKKTVTKFTQREVDLLVELNKVKDELIKYLRKEADFADLIRP